MQMEDQDHIWLIANPFTKPAEIRSNVNTVLNMTEKMFPWIL